MTKDEIIEMAIQAELNLYVNDLTEKQYIEVIKHFAKLVAEKAIKEALAKPEQKYHRGDRLICLETEEYCVIHISGTDRQWVKFPDSHIGVYINEQVAELFELLPKEPEQDYPENFIHALAFHTALSDLEPDQEPVGYVSEGEPDRLIAQKQTNLRRRTHERRSIEAGA